MSRHAGGGGYNAAKFAVRAMTKVLRLELLGRPIRVTEIDPGMVETEFRLVRFRGDQRAADAVYEGMTPLTPDDVADCIAFAVTRPSHVNIEHDCGARARSVGRRHRAPSADLTGRIAPRAILPSRSPSGRSAVAPRGDPLAAAAGRLDPQPLTRRQRPGRLRRQLLAVE